jgi:membrane protease YdiL (CAAX protease family)
VSKNEKGKNFLAQIGFPKKGYFREIILTLFLMAFVMGFGLLSLYTGSDVKIVFLNKFDFAKLGTILALALASAVSEEVVGRGFLFNYLHKYSKSFFMALFISSTLFFILYLPGALTLNLSGPDLLLNLVLNFTLSFITGIAYYMRKNILPSIGMHAMIVFWFDLLLSATP